MPDIGFFELLIVGAIAFLILGPERTPEFFAQIGRFARQGRAWISDLKQQFDAETKSIKEPVQEIRDALDEGLNNVTSNPKSNDTERK
ncbi:MAG: hypothetical protein Q9M20_02045 [Mariprofundaceae bacterium]|nr:hypothetical protein [Mariprofundaceae bacterium]